MQNMQNKYANYVYTENMQNNMHRNTSIMRKYVKYIYEDHAK